MAAKLILTLDGAVIREYPIERESISIGRKHGNDIQLNDMTVSGRHALITTLVGNTFVEDLGSSNGTLVNGSPVSKLLIMHGDTIQVGTHQFTYYNEDKVDYEPTMFVKAEFAETQVIANSPANNDNIKGLPLAGVKILNGPFANSNMEMRKPFNTLGYKGIKMAMISRGNMGYSICSIKSRRGKRASDIPLVNGVRIGTDPHPLKEHDIIEMAGFQMEFYFIQ